MATHCPDRPYICYVCDKPFTHAFSLKRHMKTHLDVGIDVLHQLLPRRYLSVTDERRDKVTVEVRQPASDDQQPQIGAMKVWSCAVCSKRCGSRQTLKRHMLQHDGCVTAHICSQCGKRFLATYELNRHMRCHDRQMNASSGNAFFAARQFQTQTCLECGVEFSTARLVNRHMAIVHPGLTHKPYACTVCSKRFVHPYSLKRHRMQHVAGADMFACETCDKRFTTTYERDRHRRIHSTDRPYGCQLCHKQFSQAYHLTSHMITHTGQKTFMCDVCQRGFAQSFALKRHMNIHRRPATSSNKPGHFATI